MFTPQQIDEISFDKAVFGGYDMNSVDEFLEPLTEDYVTLYKENALLKSKMRVLVEKLEEYRSNEASMRDALVNAQKTCDKMVREAEVKCTKMLNDANAAAAENAKNADARIDAENARVEEAKRDASARISEIQEQMKACIQSLEHIKLVNRPLNRTVQAAAAAAAAPAEGASAPAAEADPAADAVADEIAQSLEALVGTTEDSAPTPAPAHPASSETTSKFTNLQFGRNYNPTDLGE